MILDNQMRLSNAQALSSTGALSTNQVDLGLLSSFGVGTPMAVVFSIGVAADQTTGDEDYTFAVEVGSDSGITTARQELTRVKFESGTPAAPALDADLLVAGFQFALPLPPFPLSIANRYLAARYTLAGTTPTVTVTADLVPLEHVPVAAIYPKGYVIS